MSQPAEGDSIGRAAAKSVPWLVMTNVASKSFSLAAQLVLGILLLPEDFGVYAIVAAITLLTRALQDGGVREYLIQRGREKFADDAVDAFWLIVLVNVLVGAVLAILASPISKAYGEPQLADLLYIVAASIPLASMWIVSSTQLLLEFRFAEYALVSLLASGVQYGGIVVFASLGYGALSFVIPLPIMALASSVGGWLVARGNPVARLPSPASWLRMIDASRWLAAAALAAALFSQGDYLAVGAIVSSTVLGVYYFAFQIPAQLGVFASTFGGVLLSALSRVETMEEQGKALARTLSALMMLLCGASMLIAAIYPALEEIFWSGKWEASIVPVVVLALLMPFRLLYIVGKTAYLTAAQFRLWSFIVAAEATGLVLVAAGTALVLPTPTGLALGVGMYLSISVLWITSRGVRAYGITPTRLLSLVIPPWVLSILAYGTASVPFRTLDNAVLSLVLQGSVYSVVAIALFRFFASNTFRDCLTILPDAIESRALSWLRLQRVVR